MNFCKQCIYFAELYIIYGRKFLQTSLDTVNFWRRSYWKCLRTNGGPKSAALIYVNFGWCKRCLIANHICGMDGLHYKGQLKHVGLIGCTEDLEVI